MKSIFSTYSTGENRVTASFLAVLRSLSLDRIQRLLGSLLEQSEFELIRFKNQDSKGNAGVPDAVISSSIRLIVETKIARNAVGVPQLTRHLARLDQASEANKILLVLTPDDQRPREIEKIGDSRVAWASFGMVDQAIDEMLDDNYAVISEREAFLLRELQSMFEEEGLLANPNDVLVVAARNAWPEYLEIHAYVCQPNRAFQHVTYLAFYSRGQIQPSVPKILEVHDEVEMTVGKHRGTLGQLVDTLVTKGMRPKGGLFKVLLLSPPDATDTIELGNPILNDKRSKSGAITAFTMGQRYVASESLRRAKTTTELDQ